MKYITFLLLTMVAISCNFKNEDTHNHETGEEHHDDETTEKISDHDDHDENSIYLTAKQIASASMKIEPIGKKQKKHRVPVTGTIEVPPQNKATIYSPMEAFVYETHLLPGDTIKKGQTVAVLQHPNFTQLQYAYLEAVNKRNVAKADYDRKKSLLESEIASRKSFQIAEGAYRSSQSLVDSYNSQLKMIGLSPSLVSKKGIQQFIYVKSPIDGYVVENNLNKGKFLTGNFEMMEIIDPQHMHAELRVFSADVVNIQPKDKFVFQPSGIDISYNGYIKLISQKVDNNNKTVDVHGHFDDPKHLLKAGMSINAEILIVGTTAFAVPENAVVEIEGENFVFTTTDNLKFIPIEVTLGNDNDGYIEIKSIQNNNFNINIVTDGSHYLKGELLKKSGGMEGHSH